MIYRIVFSTFIAIAAVAILFGIMQLLLTDLTTPVTCRLHKNVIRHIPLPGYADQPMPEICSVDPKEERQRVDSMTNSILSYFIIQCWEKAEKGMYGKNLECYELYSKNVAEKIDETTVTQQLEKDNKCQIMQNSWLDIENRSYSGSCGTENRIMWKLQEEIEDGTTIILKYNPLAHWVEVI